MLAAGLLLAGCGGPGYRCVTVSGTVTIDDKPVPKGSITFTPTGPGQTGAPITDGKYRCENVPLGKNHVTFEARAAETQKIRDVANNVDREVPIDILPEACGAGQDVEIQPDTTVLDFPLKSSR